MATSDWKAPFLQFKDRIRPLFDAGVNLFHGVLIAPSYTSSEVTEAVDDLEAAISGKVLVAAIETPTRNCKHHAHYFFGDESACRVFEKSLEGLDRWIRAIPKNLLPEFHLPVDQSTKYRNITKWACIVYYLAWELDLAYLRGMVEIRPTVADSAFEPWADWPQPDGNDPRPLLIHQGDSAGDLQPLIEKFAADGKHLPEIIDAYLQGESLGAEFITTSLSAVDVLVFMLDQIRGQESARQNELACSIKRKPKRGGRVTTDVTLLKAFLRIHHDPRETGKKALDPLTTEQIAIAMEWFAKSGKPLQSKASRRMTEIFGSNAMEKYRSIFQGNIRSGFKRILGDGSRDIEAMADTDEEDDDDLD